MNRLVVARHRLGDEHGATAAEYALLAALIATVVIVGIAALGSSVNGLFTDSCGEVANAVSASCA